MFMAERGYCPKPQELVDAQIFPKERPLRDRWGTPYQITCAQEGATVVSAGPDRSFNTDDDIE
jgi:hypothetical protein